MNSLKGDFTENLPSSGEGFQAAENPLPRRDLGG